MAKRVSAISDMEVSPLLRESAWITRQVCIHDSISRTMGIYNVEANAASRITHLLVFAFLKRFRSNFPEPTTWRLSPLAPTMKPWMHKMLLTRQSAALKKAVVAKHKCERPRQIVRLY